MTNFDPWAVFAALASAVTIVIAWLRYRTMKLHRIPDITVKSSAMDEDGWRQGITVEARTSGGGAKWLVREVRLKRPRRLRISATKTGSPWMRRVRFHPAKELVVFFCRMEPDSDTEVLKLRVKTCLRGKPMTRRSFTIDYKLQNWQELYRKAGGT